MAAALEAHSKWAHIATMAFCDVFNPKCVGKGVKLGSGSSPGVGGIWTSGDFQNKEHQNVQHENSPYPNVGRDLISRTQTPPERLGDYF